jgi:hypothetical protein
VRRYEIVALIESEEQLWARLGAVRAAAHAILRQHGADIRDLCPYVVSLSLGPGWGRGAEVSADGTTTRIVAVRDDAVIAVAASRDDCPRAQPYSTVAGIPCSSRTGDRGRQRRLEALRHHTVWGRRARRRSRLPARVSDGSRPDRLWRWRTTRGRR